MEATGNGQTMEWKGNTRQPPPWPLVQCTGLASRDVVMVTETSIKMRDISLWNLAGGKELLLSSRCFYLTVMFTIVFLKCSTTERCVMYANFCCRWNLTVHNGDIIKLNSQTKIVSNSVVQITRTRHIENNHYYSAEKCLHYITSLAILVHFIS